MTPDQIADRLGRVLTELERVGRPDLRIVAVTKGFPDEVVRAAIDAGIVDIGESYAQEVLAKEAAYEGAALHFIGRIQRNKVRKIAPLVHLWHSVSRPEVIEEIARRQPGARILIQVNASEDETKDGVPPSAVDGMLQRAAAAELETLGLMTIGVFDDPAATRTAFDTVNALADRLGLPERSMGMSADYLDAAAAGATIIRLGTTLFGPRPDQPWRHR